MRKHPTHFSYYISEPVVDFIKKCLLDVARAAKYAMSR
jgi:hypothetical protein